MDVNDRMLQISQDRLKKAVSVYRKTLSLTLQGRCNKEKATMEQGTLSKTDSDEGHNGPEKMYAVDKLVRYIGSRLGLRYVVRWYRYGKTYEAAESHLSKYLSPASRRTNDDLTSREAENRNGGSLNSSA